MADGRESAKLRMAAAMGGLDGALWCSLANHAADGLVGLPLWLLFATAIALAAILFSCHGKRAALAGMIAGAALFARAPHTLAPPRPDVLTHAPALSRGVDLFAALDRVDENPQAWEGKKIAVTGLWHPAAGAAPAAVYRTVMACCAADSVNVGFDVVAATATSFPPGAAVRVSGTLASVQRDGDLRYELRSASVCALGTRR